MDLAHQRDRVGRHVEQRGALRNASISPFGPSATASTSAGAGSEVNTTSHCFRHGARASAQSAPAARDALPLPPQIVHDELVAGLLQIGRHARAHHAEPDKSDRHCRFLRSE